MRTQSWRDYYGPWAVVTGASDGIGRELAYELAAAGLNLVLVARRVDRLEAIATQLSKQYGIQARTVAVDLSTPTGAAQLLEANRGLPIGLLIAAAGFGTAGPFLATPIDTSLSMVNVNCSAVVALTHAYGQQFAARGRGGIILFSSLVAFQGVPGSAVYAATKAFIQSLAEALHHELAPHGVDVLAAAPGPVASGFGEQAGMDLAGGSSPRRVAQVTLNALGRRAFVRPAGLSKLLGWSLMTAPRWLRVRILEVVMRGMTVSPHGGKANKEGTGPA